MLTNSCKTECKNLPLLWCRMVAPEPQTSSRSHDISQVSQTRPLSTKKPGLNFFFDRLTPGVNEFVIASAKINVLTTPPPHTHAHVHKHGHSLTHSLTHSFTHCQSLTYYLHTQICNNVWNTFVVFIIILFKINKTKHIIFIFIVV